MSELSTVLGHTVRKYFPEHPDIDEKSREVREWCRRENCHLILPTNPVCHLLSQIADPPRILFVVGNFSLLSLLSLAVVGTRRPSGYGLSAAVRFSRKLAEVGFCIVSGLARGIDAAAHRGALLAGGPTIAVLGHGLDHRYPHSNVKLADDILAAGGCLVSEYPPGVPPRAHHFPARNRIISGLSLGTLVVEAAVKSGSLITARMALEQNREVFVLPGRFDDEGFQGGHLLIQQGAKLVLKPQDLVDELPPLSHTVLTSTEDPRWLRLKELFGALDRTYSYTELFSRAGSRTAALASELQAAVAEGVVTETCPQHFLWSGSE